MHKATLNPILFIGALSTSVLHTVSARLSGSTLHRQQPAARTLVGESLEDDPWRKAGEEPMTIKCGSNQIPTTKNRVGSVIMIGVNDLCDYSGVLLQDSSEGGQNIGWLQQGHSVTFDVALSTPGLYEMKVRVASITGDGALELTNRDTSETYKVFRGVPKTGDWQAWETLSAGRVALPSGSTTIQANSLQSGWNLLWIKLTMVEVLDNRIMVYAEDLDIRPDTAELHQSSSEGLNNVAYIHDGHKLSFQVNLAYSGTYRVEARVSNADGVDGSFLLADSPTARLYGNVDFLPKTSRWDDWASVRVVEMYLPAGEHAMDILVEEGGWNLEWLSFTLTDKATTLSTASTSTRHRTKETEEAEEASTFVRLASEYTAQQGVVVDWTNGNVGQIDTGDWVEYSLYVPSTGMYTISLHVASPEGRGKLYLATGIDLNDAMDGAVVSVPATAGWHDWETVAIENVALEAGNDVPLRIVAEDGFWNLFLIEYELVL